MALIRGNSRRTLWLSFTLGALSSGSPLLAVSADKGGPHGSAAVDDLSSTNAVDLDELFNDEVLVDSTRFETGNAERIFDAGDLSPYFSDGRLLDAKTAFDRRRYRQALVLLQSAGDQVETKYLRALAALNAGLWQAAAAAFEQLADQYRPLRDDCLYNAGRARERVGHFSRAVRAYQAIDAGSRFFGEAQLSIARIYAREKRFRRALEILRPVAGAGVLTKDENFAAQVVWTFANIALRNGDYSSERWALFKLWASYPTASLALEAGRRLAAVPIPVSVKVQRAYRLIERNLNSEADALVAPLLNRFKIPDPLGCAIHLAHGVVLRKSRHHPQAIHVLRPVARQCKDERVRARAFLALAYSQSVVEPQEAIATYEQFAREFPRHAEADEALFCAVDLRLRTGDQASAQLKHTQIASRFWLKRLAAEAEFQLFWIHRKEGDLAAALTVLEETEARESVGVSPLQVARARYWKARLLEETGRPKEAVETFKKLAVDISARFYGFLAEQKLKALDPGEWEKLVAIPVFPSASREAWPLNAGPLSWNRHFLAGVELARLGLPGAVAELLLADTSDLPTESRRLLFQILFRTGHLGQARNIARALGPQALDSSDISRLWWEASFPRVFRPSIEKHSRAAGVDPDLMQALIREESLFNANARSATGALGLSQLMLPTARGVSRDLGLGKVRTATLLDADRNIQIGSAYLGHLLREFSGDTLRAVGAYNAGPQAIRRWSAINETSDPDEWVEQIPVSETREYIKRVLGSFYTYRLLFDAQWPRLLSDESWTASP